MGGFEEKNAVDKLEIILLKDKLYNKQKFCEICGTDKNLTIHHKDETSKHPEKMFDEENCQILCRRCHDKIHGIKKRVKNKK